jgi:hypothetical protein
LAALGDCLCSGVESGEKLCKTFRRGEAIAPGLFGLSELLDCLGDVTSLLSEEQVGATPFMIWDLLMHGLGEFSEFMCSGHTHYHSCAHALSPECLEEFKRVF